MIDICTVTDNNGVKHTKHMQKITISHSFKNTGYKDIIDSLFYGLCLKHIEFDGTFPDWVIFV